MSSPHHLTFQDIEHQHDRFALRRARPGAAVRLHTHAYFELVLVVRGHATHHFGGAEYAVGAGDLLAVSPWIPHRYVIPRQEPRFTIVIANFGFDALTDALEDSSMMSMLSFLSLGRLHSPGAPPGLFRPAPHRVQSYFRWMEEEARNAGQGSRSMLISLLHLTLMELYRHRDPAERLDESLDVLRVLRALPVIHQQATSPETGLRNIASAAGLSPSYFGRRFKQLIGESVTHYIQRVRILKALQILATTDLSIEEIAGDVGYRDPGTFRSVFRSVTGSTPHRFKRPTLAPSS